MPHNLEAQAVAETVGDDGVAEVDGPPDHLRGSGERKLHRNPIPQGVLVDILAVCDGGDEVDNLLCREQHAERNKAARDPQKNSRQDRQRRCCPKQPPKRRQIAQRVEPVPPRLGLTLILLGLHVSHLEHFECLTGER